MKRKLFSLITVLFFLLNSVFIVNASIVNTLSIDDELNQEEYDLLILTPLSFKLPLIRLADHKNSYNMNTKVVTLFEIYNSKYFSAHGRDDPEKIKYFIKNAHEEWNIKYVMLVGSVDRLPMRKACVWDSQVITDLYYSDIYDENGSFSSWDSNNNNKFGEYLYNETGAPSGKETDIVDLNPDLGVGRLPCRNIIEVNTMVDKIIKYEAGAYYNDSWFNRMIFCGGELWSESRYYKFEGWRNGILEGECNNRVVMDNVSGFTPVTLWHSLGNITPESIQDELNKGAGFAYFSGHGVQYWWVPTDPYKDEAKDLKYWFYKISKLSNGYKLPVMFFDSCLTGQLDYEVLGMPFDCISWRFVKHRNGGAIANIASSRVAFMGPVEGGGTMLALYFFKNYSHENPRILSDMYMQAQKEYIQNFGDCFTLYEYNIIGDPSLRIGGYPSSEEIEENTLNVLEKFQSMNSLSLLERLHSKYLGLILTKQDDRLISKIKSNRFSKEEISPDNLKTYDTGQSDVTNAIEIDSNDNMVSTGYSFNDEGYTIYTIKYDENYTELWNRSITSNKSEIFFSHDLVIDPNDNIFIVGFEGNWSNDFYPIGSTIIYKYDKDGNELWNKSFKRGFLNMGTGIAINSENDIIITTSMARVGEAGLGGWIGKCDGENGNLTWERIFHKYFFMPTKKPVVDSEDNIIISCDGSIVIKYDKNGDIIWEKRYHSGYETLYDIDIDSKDNIVVTGLNYKGVSSGDHFSSYIYTMKIDKTGKVLWNDEYSPLFGNDMAFAVTVDSQDNILVGGASYPYAELKPSGKGVKPLILKYDSEGKMQWVKEYDFEGTIYDISSNQNGKVFTAGIKINNDDYYIADFSS